MSDLLAPDYQVRHPKPSDAVAVHALILASDLAEFGESSGYGLDELEDDWTRIDLNRDALVVTGPSGELAGYGYIQHRRYVRIDVEIYVHPAHFGRGIGTTLIHRAEGRADEFVQLAPPPSMKTGASFTRNRKRRWPTIGVMPARRSTSGENRAWDRTSILGSGSLLWMAMSR